MNNVLFINYDLHKKDIGQTATVLSFFFLLIIVYIGLTILVDI